MVGRREAKTSNGQEACTLCRRRLPRSAFPKAELSRGGSGHGRCRDCVAKEVCHGCQQLLPPSSLCASSKLCATCRGNAHVDRVLQTPKDEVTHCGALRAQGMDRESEYNLFLVCSRRGLHDRMLLRRILSYFRIPYVVSQNGFHYCELCDTSFPEAPICAGAKLQMMVDAQHANWKECPCADAKLPFLFGDSHVVSEVRQMRNGAWFFRTRTALRTILLPNADSHPRFESLWAPLSATDAARRPSPLAAHLSSNTHRELEESVVSRTSLLVSRAAHQISRELNENPSLSLSRFRAGLGLVDRFCSPCDVERAKRLERVRDADVPAKFLREHVGARDKELVWITTEALSVATAAYLQQHRATGKRGTGKRASGRAPKDPSSKAYCGSADSNRARPSESLEERHVDLGGSNAPVSQVIHVQHDRLISRQDDVHEVPVS
eukprot:TRINITY_DN65538_c0_g1_i1.p1 TRINITY_DN65538_c0_g1~~TRINITY_DN65538_c0_g1_i1.p1  ORF type:complete len:437 (-),score=35.59 TRINITY_DN65538_c0_g1_i1:79-1389(-)